MPPLPPKSNASYKLKMEQMQSKETEIVVKEVNQGLDHIEEDINPDNHIQETDADLYQIPISGGIPIKLDMNSARPFTPPFAQLVRMQREAKPMTQVESE